MNFASKVTDQQHFIGYGTNMFLNHNNLIKFVRLKTYWLKVYAIFIKVLSHKKERLKITCQ